MESVVKTDLKRIVIVTGVSGAGKSVAIGSFEDLGFYCIDNLPSEMLDAAIEFFLKSPFKRFAVGLHIRSKLDRTSFEAIRQKLLQHFVLDVMFLSADHEVIATRYNATRRRHPFLDHGGELGNAILREKRSLEDIESLSDVILDTSFLSSQALSRQIEQRYAGDEIKRLLHVSITSFGFKNGQLRPADEVFDVRFMDNPFYVAGLKDKTGLSPAVSDYVLNDPKSAAFVEKWLDLHEFLLPLYFAEGKNYFHIGIGCTGGKHRSVAIAEKLGSALVERNIANLVVTVKHRDVL